MNINEDRKLLLGFDMGTSGLKCVAFEAHSGRRYSVYSEWKLLTSQSGYAEFDCDELWSHIIDCIKRLSTQYGLDCDRIAAIGFCALCPGLIAIDKNGKELSRCIIFMDARSSVETEYINRAMPFEKSFDIVANRIMSGATSVSTMLWLKNNTPEIYDATEYFLHLPSWAGYKLTGKIGMDLSNASATGLYNIHTQAWSDDMCKAAGISKEKLPPLTDAVRLLGGVNNPELISLGIRAGTPVSVGSGDTVSAMLALGIEPGKAMLSLGTSHVLYTVSRHDRFYPLLMGRSFVFQNMWAMGGAMSNPGVMLRWFRDKFCADLVARSVQEGISAYELIDIEAEKSSPGAGGLICLPYINGERTPVYDSKARAVFMGLNLDTDLAHIARAIMEGAAFGIRQLMEMLESVLGEAIDEIYLTGGGSRSELMCRIMADVTGRNMQVLDLADAGAVGAGLTAGIAAGLLYADNLPQMGNVSRRIQPNTELSNTYNKAFQRYLEIYPALKALF